MDIVPPGADLEASVPPEAVLENPKQWELEGEANDIVPPGADFEASVPPGAVLEDMRPRTLCPELVFCMNRAKNVVVDGCIRLHHI